MAFRWFAAVAGVLVLISTPAPARSQAPVDLEAGDEIHYPWTLGAAAGGFDSGSIGDQTSRVVAIPVSIWLRRLTEERRVGLRLRLTGVLGFQDFERLQEFDVNSIRLGGVFPGLEALFPLSRRSMLRPFADIGIGLTNTAIDEVWLTTFGLLSEFVFPWKRWELGLEPRAQVGLSWADTDLLDQQYAWLSARADARYPLRFEIGGSTPDVGVYLEPGWFPNDLVFSEASGVKRSVVWQYEFGATLGFRDLAPKIWFIRVPRLGVGYRFGDGLTGWRIRIGGERVTRLPLP